MNKHFSLLLFLVLLLNGRAWAQTPTTHNSNDGCGTVMPTEILDWISAKRFYENSSANNNRDIYYIPIQFHVVGTTQGEGYFASDEVFRLLCQLNRNFEPVGFYFYVTSPTNYIDNTNYYEHDYNAGENMMNNNNVNNHVNVYIVKDPAGNCGYFTWQGDAVAVAQSCSGNNSTTLTHELGHFFSLPHTFSGWEGAYDAENNLVDAPPSNQQERANGSNCATAGDRFCDTPADYVSYRWNCPGGLFTDPTGATFNPDGTYYMSYSNDACQKLFSNEQIAAMRSFLLEERSNLVGSSASLNFAAPEPTQVYYPANTSQNVNNNNVLFSWANSTADYYYLEAIQYDNPNGTNLRVFVEDTFYVANLDPNYNYYYAIIPLNNGNTCSAAASGYFRTGPSNAIYLSGLSVQTPNCNGDTNGSATISVSGGGGNYSYLWSNGSTTNSISNAPAATYIVTVTAAGGSSQTLMVAIPQPNALNANTVQNGDFAALTQPTGGTAPYTIQWSNGVTGSSATGLAVGENTIVITDSNGCSYTENITILGIQADVLNIPCTDQTASIAITPIGGVEPYEYEWSTGSDNAALNNLNEGVYYLTVTDQSNAHVELSYQITNPTPLQIGVQVAGNTAFAQASGGTPPYSYYWPTGLTNQASATNLPPFTYEMFLYDANNCFVSTNFTVSAALGSPSIATDKQINLSPTLLHSGTPLTCSHGMATTNTALQIYNNGGQLVWEQKNLPTNTVIPTNGWASGMYVARWISEQGVQTVKLMLAR